MLQKLVKIFRADSVFHLIIIFTVFGISGSASVFISGPVLEFLRVDKIIDSFLIYTLIRFIIVFPIYQVVLILVALVFGQFSYFWEFEKKFLKRIMLLKN